VNSVTPLWYMCTHVRPSGEFLRNFVALLWVEVGQPFSTLWHCVSGQLDLQVPQIHLCENIKSQSLILIYRYERSKGSRRVMLSVRLLLVFKLEVIFISLVLQMALPHFICLFGDIRSFMIGKSFFFMYYRR